MAAAPSAVAEAIPDFDVRVVSTTTNRDRAAVRWTATGTFSGADLQRIAATGAADRAGSGGVSCRLCQTL